MTETAAVIFLKVLLGGPLPGIPASDDCANFPRSLCLPVHKSWLAYQCRGYRHLRYLGIDFVRAADVAEIYFAKDRFSASASFCPESSDSARGEATFQRKLLRKQLLAKKLEARC